MVGIDQSDRRASKGSSSKIWKKFGSPPTIIACLRTRPQLSLTLSCWGTDTFSTTTQGKAGFLVTTESSFSVILVLILERQFDAISVLLTTVENSQLRYITSRSMGCCPELQNQTRIPSCSADLQFNRCLGACDVCWSCQLDTN